MEAGDPRRGGDHGAGRDHADQDREIRAALANALEAGASILASGGSALDAVETAVKKLEDNPHFNAGRGAVFTYQGTNELDAAIMEGAERRSGAVPGATGDRNPVSLARAVMEKEPARHAERRGADEFSRLQDLPQVAPEWFELPERRRQLEEMKASGDGSTWT
jgi:beta-aspartyl-peptidase (threonine type)